MMNSLRKLNSSWQNCRNDTSLARMWQHKSSNPCLAIRGKIRINETIPAHHNENCETNTLCQFQHCSIFNISSIKLNGSASLTHFSLTSPKERCACNGSILLETCCRMIIRKKKTQFYFNFLCTGRNLCSWRGLLPNPLGTPWYTPCLTLKAF